MSVGTDFTFHHAPSRKFSSLENNEAQNLLMQWWGTTTLFLLYFNWKCHFLPTRQVHTKQRFSCSLINITCALCLFCWPINLSVQFLSFWNGFFCGQTFLRSHQQLMCATHARSYSVFTAASCWNILYSWSCLRDFILFNVICRLGIETNGITSSYST